jgi:hypothetical protein
MERNASIFVPDCAALNPGYAYSVFDKAASADAAFAALG